MKISTLSLELLSGQTKIFDGVANLTELKVQLRNILDSVDFVEVNDALTMPKLIIEVQFSQVEITFTYELLDKEEGFLILYYNNGKEADNFKRSLVL